jgi:hypothetical protein
MTRRSLAQATSVAGTVRWQGNDVPARTVRVTPYVDDPYKGRFAAEAGTEYTFVVSKAVPGQLVQLRAAVPSGRTEVLTLVGDGAPGDRR